MSTNRPVLPAEVVDALRQGRLIEAIKLLRQQQGLGLKEAKELIALARGQLAARSLASESMQAPPSPPHPAASSPTPPSALPDGLAPGEVPRQSNSVSWVLALVAAALLCWYLLR